MKVLKKLKSISLFSIGALTLLISSCSGGPANMKVIPSNANAVAVFDIYSIISKGKLDELSEMKFFKSFKKEVRNESRGISKIMDEIIEDPEITGIDFTSNLFAYYIDDAKDEKFISFSFGLSSASDFVEFMENAADKVDEDLDIDEEDGYSYTMLGNEGLLGWNDDMAIILMAENYGSRQNLDLGLESLMELKSEDQISSNDAFNEFYDNKKDVSFWMSSNLMEDSREFEQMEKELDFDLSDNYVSAHLNFEDEHISLLTDVTANEDLQKLMDENDFMDNSFNDDLLEYFQKKSYLAASMAFNMMEYYKVLEKNEDFDEMKDEFQKETKMELKDLFATFNGSALYSISGFENTKYTYMGYGKGFNKDAAVALDTLRSIADAGTISAEKKELLNQGKTVQTQSFRGKYCINIKNVLASGGNVESAIAANSKINWFEGGWEYGRFDERTEEAFLPIMSMAVDINGSANIKKIIDDIPEGEVTKNGDYYEFKFDRRYPAYFAYNEEVFLITNDEKSIKAFKDGGLDENLDDSEISSSIEDNNLFMYANLNYDEYPKSIKKELKKSQNDEEEKLYEIWNEFAKSMELKLIDKNSFEMILNTKEGDNSLNTLITTLDDNYENMMDM